MDDSNNEQLAGMIEKSKEESECICMHQEHHPVYTVELSMMRYPRPTVQYLLSMLLQDSLMPADPVRTFLFILYLILLLSYLIILFGYIRD